MAPDGAPSTTVEVKLDLGVLQSTPDQAPHRVLPWQRARRAQEAGTAGQLPKPLRRDIADQLNAFPWKPERKAKGKGWKGRKNGD